MISQREARRLRKRVEELERMEDGRRGAWVREYPGGVHLDDLTSTPVSLATAVFTARKLGHAVVVTCNDKNTIQFFALPLKGR